MLFSAFHVARLKGALGIVASLDPFVDDVLDIVEPVIRPATALDDIASVQSTVVKETDESLGFSVEAVLHGVGIVAYYRLKSKRAPQENEKK